MVVPVDTEDQPSNTVVVNPVVTPAVQEQARETIIVTKVIEVIEEGEESQPTVTVESEEDKNTLMIMVPAIIVGVLVLVIGGMIVRYAMTKRGKAKAINSDDVKAAKTDIVEEVGMDIEPQFVMDEDDAKNIFARPSTAGLT